MINKTVISVDDTYLLCDQNSHIMILSYTGITGRECAESPDIVTFKSDKIYVRIKIGSE